MYMGWLLLHARSLLHATSKRSVLTKDGSAFPVREASDRRAVRLRLPRAAGMVTVLPLLCLAACGTKAIPCGVFTFAGTALPVGGSPSRGITMSLNFDFDPTECTAPNCNCNTIAYIQIVRILDIDTGNHLQPFSEQSNRMITGNSAQHMNGWAVDRLVGRVWGYYGRNNNGSFAGILTTGSNSSDAILRDTPSGWPDGSWFDAVTVPVCINAGSPCVNELLGYYYWLFAVGTGGTVGDPHNEIAAEWHRDAFDLSVTEWNTDAPGLSKNSFPAMSRMP